jgi:hypothetical protein
LSNRATGESGYPSLAGGGPRAPLAYFRKSLSGAAGAALRSSRNQHVLALVILPILLVWINNNIIFGSPIGSDNFVYSGFHLHLPEFLSSRFADTYYAARMPWNALGYLAHRLLDTEQALYALRIFVFYVAAFSLYSAVSTIFADRSAAFAATMLFGTNTWFLAAIGWDYVDGAYVACLLLSLAMMAGAALGHRWRLAAIGWGATVALTVSLYILWTIFVPIEIGMFICLNRLGRRRDLYAVAALAFIGAVAALACMGCVSWFFGGKFLYLLPQIKSMVAVAANRSTWDVPLSRWLWRAPWLLIPAAIWAFSAVWTVLDARSAFGKFQSADREVDVNSRLWIASVFCVGALLLFVGLEVAGFRLFMFDDKARALFPFAYVVLGGVLAAGRREPSQHKLIYTLTVIVVTLAPWIATATLAPHIASGFDLIAPHPSFFMGPIAATVWVAIGFLVLWTPFVGGRLKYVLVTLFFSVISFGAGDNSWIKFPPDPFYRQATLAVFEASRAISPFNPKAQALFWFDAKDPLAEQLRDVVSTYLYQYSLLNENFPNLTDAKGDAASIEPGDRIIILTSGEDPLPAATRAVADKGLVFQQVVSKRIRREGIAFTFVVADVVRAKGAAILERSSRV